MRGCSQAQRGDARQRSRDVRAGQVPPVRFVDCSAGKVDHATLTRSSARGATQQLSLEMHHCDDPNCPIPRVGGWKRALNDIEASMGRDGENFLITNLKDSSIKKKLVRS